MGKIGHMAPSGRWYTSETEIILSLRLFVVSRSDAFLERETELASVPREASVTQTWDSWLQRTCQKLSAHGQTHKLMIRRHNQPPTALVIT